MRVVWRSSCACWTAASEAPSSSSRASGSPAVTCCPGFTSSRATCPVARANTASAGAEVELALVVPVAFADELPPEEGSSIDAPLPVTMRPTPPTVTTTSPRVAVTVETSGALAVWPLWAIQMATPISAATTSAVTARARCGLREINAGIRYPFPFGSGRVRRVIAYEPVITSRRALSESDMKLR